MTAPRTGKGAHPGEMRRAHSIRTRVVLALTAVSVFTLVVVGIAFYAFLGGYIIERQKDQLLDQAIGVAEQIEGFVDQLPGVMEGGKALTALLQSDLRALPAGSGVVVFHDGEVIGKAGVLPVRGQVMNRLKAEGERVGGHQPGIEIVKSFENTSGRQTNLLVAAAPIESSSGMQGVAVVTLATSNAFAARGGLLRLLLFSGIIGVALAVGVGLVLGSWLTRPLRRLSIAARNMAGGAYDSPVSGSYPGEIQGLAASLETMRREVKHSEESLRGFVAAAAHELRTPLTSIQGFSQALLDGTAASEEERQRSAAAIYRESARLQRLIDALLTLSRYDSGEFRPNSIRVDVGDLICEEMERLEQAGLVTATRLKVQVDAGAAVVSDPDMLRQMVANLLRNAVQYGGEDPIQVVARVERGWLLLDVSNGGPPIEPEDRARIFDRFYRGSGGRRMDGFGLGLALTREICEVLGGSVELTDETPRTTFRVKLPAGPQGVLAG